MPIFVTSRRREATFFVFLRIAFKFAKAISKGIFRKGQRGQDESVSGDNTPRHLFLFDRFLVGNVSGFLYIIACFGTCVATFFVLELGRRFRIATTGDSNRSLLGGSLFCHPV